MGKSRKQLNGGVVAHMKNDQTVDVVSQASLTSLRDETENSLKAVLVVVTGFHRILLLNGGCCRSPQVGVVQGRRHSYLETLKPGDTLGTFSHRETFSHQWTFSTCILPQLQSFHLLKSSHSRIHTLP